MKDQKRKLNNKGFSLVELIVVIAIIGVLVGVATPQVIKYIEKSRVAADANNVEVIKGAVEMALVNEKAYNEAINVIAADSTNKDMKVTISNGSPNPTIKYDHITGDSSFQKEFQTILTELPTAKAKGTTGFEIIITNNDDNLKVDVKTK